MASALTQVIYEVFPRRPGIVQDLIERQADYDQAQELINYATLAITELEKQLEELEKAEMAAGVDKRPKLLRHHRKIACLREFVAKLEKIEEPARGYVTAELIRAAENT